MELQANERLDDLLIGNLKIIQHQAEFCFSLDAILLAHFATVSRGSRVVDLGTGTGVIALIISTRAASHIVGVELNQTMARLAERSVKLNNLADRIRILSVDMRNIAKELPAGEWDLVVSNPPYRPVGTGLLNPNDKIASARHELTVTLKEVINAAKHLVKTRGRFAMVHLPERCAEIIKVMSEAGLEPKRMQLVYPGVKKRPVMLLIEGIRGAKPGMDVLEPLIVYNADGSYSQDILRIYKDRR